MPKTIEDDLKLENWLSILTYDITKYVAAGGKVTAVYAMPEGHIMIQLHNVNIEKTHGKFQDLLETAQPPEPAAEPIAE